MGCGGSVASPGTGRAVARKYKAHLDIDAWQVSSKSGFRKVASSTGSWPPRCASESRHKIRTSKWQPCRWDTIPADVKRLNLGSFEQQDVLVQTEVATILRMRQQEGGHLLSGKRIERGCSARTVHRFVNEVVRLHALSASASVVGFHGICECPSEFWLITDLCGGGSVDLWLSRWPATTRGVVRQLLEAVQHLHSCLVCHLDLKPSAVLLTDAGRVRLCGLDDAREIQREGQLLFGISGSPGFQAPEVQGCSGYCGVRADVYSLGRTLKVATCHETMWEELAEVRLKMMSEDPEQRPSLVSAADLLFSCGWTPPSTGEEQLQPAEQVPPCRQGRIRRSRGSAARRSNYQLDAVNTGLECDSNNCSVGSQKDGGQGRSDGNARDPHMVPKLGKQNDATIQFQPRRLPPLPRSCSVPVLHQPSEGMGDAQSPSGRLQTLPCGSVLCARLGSCLCHDRLPLPTSALKSGFTNAAGNQSVGVKVSAIRCPTCLSLGDLGHHHRNRSMSPGRSHSVAGSTREVLARGAHGSMELLE